MTRPAATARAALQHGGDLDRVVAVIVDDRDAVPLAGRGEAALHAARTCASALANRLVADAQLVGDGDGGQRVLDVVLAEHRQDAGRIVRSRCRAAVGDDDVEARQPSDRARH